MSRLFIAIDLPDDRRSGLRNLQDEALSARWTPPEQYHLTLRFLGDSDEQQAEMLQERLTRIDLPSFLLGGEGLGVFPSIRRPRVLVARMSEEPGLLALQSQVAEITAEIGFQEERKPFNPHITVGRLERASSQDVRGYLKRHEGFGMEPFVVNDFRLYESQLSSAGAVHTVVEHYRLRTAAKADS